MLLYIILKVKWLHNLIFIFMLYPRYCCGPFCSHYLYGWRAIVITEAALVCHWYIASAGPSLCFKTYLKSTFLSYGKIKRFGNFDIFITRAQLHFQMFWIQLLHWSLKLVFPQVFCLQSLSVSNLCLDPIFFLVCNLKLVHEYYH